MTQSWSDKITQAGFNPDNHPETDARSLITLIDGAGVVMTALKSVRSIEDVSMSTGVGLFYDPTSSVLGHRSRGNFWCQRLYIELRLKDEYNHKTPVWDDRVQGLIIKEHWPSGREKERIMKAIIEARDSLFRRPEWSVDVECRENLDGIPVVRVTLSARRELSERE